MSKILVTVIFCEKKMTVFHPHKPSYFTKVLVEIIWAGFEILNFLDFIYCMFSPDNS